MASLRTILAIVACAWLAAGVGPRGAAAMTAAGTPDSKTAVRACSLLTAGDVRAVYGSGVRSTSHRTVGAFDSCNYSTSQGVLTFLVTTTALIEKREPAIRDAAHFFAQIKSTMPARSRSLAGLGDKALWTPTLRQLWVLRGSVLFSLSQFAPGGHTLSRLEKVARSVLKHV